MPELNIAQVAAKIAAVMDAYGLKVHEEESGGETLTRVSMSKTIASSPSDTVQQAGAFVLFNLPGDSDKYLEAAVNFLRVGNSSASPTSSTSP